MNLLYGRKGFKDFKEVKGFKGFKEGRGFKEGKEKPDYGGIVRFFLGVSF